MKKKHTYGPDDASCIVWAIICHVWAIHLVALSLSLWWLTAASTLVIVMVVMWQCCCPLSL
jgi:hypothetical protein